MQIIQLFSSQVFPQPWISQFGWTLVHFLWQGALIAALYAIARSRSRNPQVRYVMACAALAAMVAAPVGTFLFSGGTVTSNTSAVINVASVASVGHGVASGPYTFTEFATHRDVMPWLVMAWFAGAIIFWIRLLGGWAIAARMRSTLVHPAPAEWQRKLDTIRARVRVSRPVKLLVSALVQVPTVVGWLRPVVLVPVGALAGLPAGHIGALLAHELAHIRRHDYLVNILQSVVEALLFYHPAVWWISGHIRNERELCCDDVAVSIGGDAFAYARALADLKSYRPAHFDPALAANGGRLGDRVARLLGANRPVAGMFPGSGAIAAAIVILVTALALFGQSTTPPPAFDVASVKSNNSDSNISYLRIVPGGRLVASNGSLRSFITSAYHLNAFEISGGPAWLDSAKYDIEAKGESNSTPTQLLQMLQTLLADRFRLRVHREKKEMPVYALLVTKNGPKLAPAREDCFDPTGGTLPTSPEAVPCGGFSGSRNQLRGAKVTTTRLAERLSKFLSRTVIDKTSLDGAYDLTLSWTPDEAGPGSQADSGGTSIFTAIQEQLGLRLESQKGPVDVLVIDGAEKAPEN